MELIFEVRDAEEGGYRARALGHRIFTHGDTWEELRANVLEAISVHFEDGPLHPRMVQLQCVKDELIAAEAAETAARPYVSIATPMHWSAWPLAQCPRKPGVAQTIVVRRLRIVLELGRPPKTMACPTVKSLPSFTRSRRRERSLSSRLRIRSNYYLRAPPVPDS